MSSLFYYITNNKRLRIRLLFLFLGVVYVPMLLYMFFIYFRTMNIVKQERVEAIEQTLKKVSDTLIFRLNDISRISLEASSNSALRKAVQDFDYYSSYQKDMLTRFYRKEFENLENNPLIDAVVCISREGHTIFTSGASDGKSRLQVDGAAFLSSQLYKDFSTIASHEIWHYSDQNDFIRGRNSKSVLFIVQKLKGLTVEKGKPSNTEKDVGYMFTLLNPDALLAITDNVSFSPTGEVSFYDKDYNTILTKPRYPIPKWAWEANGGMGFEEPREVKLGHRIYAVGTTYINSLGWYLASVVPVEELTGPVSTALKGNFWLVAVISIIAAAWIILEVIILTRVVTEKQMADYRLLLTQESNEKLRIYKHDFANHLQIIQGLIQMEMPERALEYLSKVVKEGRITGNKYEIGIPELESAIFSSIVSAQEYDIEIRINTITLPPDIGVNVYDLAKILVNLIKNAMHALINTEAEEKVLSIGIYTALEEYVFQISNNVPLIPEELRDKIFEKGFTTKGKDGSGLGLHIVRKLVVKNQGELELKVDHTGNHFIVRFQQKER